MFECRRCGAKYPINSTGYLCECGGHFQLAIDSQLKESTTKRSMWGVGSLASTLLEVVRQIDVERFGEGIDDDGQVKSISPRAAEASKSISEIDGHLISLGEGLTPQITDIVTSTPGDRVELKLDFLNPTLSYKDRGSSMIVSAAKYAGVTQAAVDSSGNAAVSLSAYCARAGISLRVYLPEETSKSKIAQIKRFGGIVNQIPGDRSATSEAIVEDLDRYHLYYMSHIYNPLFHHGTKSLLYELLSDNNKVLPDEIIIPAGNGTLLLGIEVALSELARHVSDLKVPRVVVVQAKNVAPINSLLLEQISPSVTDRGVKDPHLQLTHGPDDESMQLGYRTVAPGVTWNLADSTMGDLHLSALTEIGGDSWRGGHLSLPSTNSISNSTLAEGIAIAKPPRLIEMAEVISKRSWPVVVVDEEEIVEAKARLSLQGVDVEDTAAATYAGAIKWLDYRRQSPLAARDSSARGDGSHLTVVELTGAGLKSPYLS